MAGYTRQAAANIVTGGVIDAADFNSEYNAIEAAFNGSTGHSHDGTAGNGPPISNLGPANDFVVTSSVVRPKTDDTYDLGTSTIEWKDGFFDGTLRTDILTVDETSTFTGNVTTVADVAIGGNLTVTGNATISGNLTFGDADTDSINLSAEIDSHIIPNTDATYDLGSATKEWRNLHIDGTANIDSLVADTADINGGSIDGTIIGANSTAAISATTINASNTITGNLSGNVTGNLTGNAATATKLATPRTLAVTGAVTGSTTFDGSGNVSIATTATSDPTITLTGAVTGSGTMTNLGNVSIATTATADPQLTLTGDVTGTATFTNLGNASLSASLAANSVGSSEIAEGAVGTSEIAANAVGSSELADDAVGNSQIADNAIHANHLNLSGNGTTSQFLRSDGDGTFTWATPSNTNTTYSAGTGMSLSGTTFNCTIDSPGEVGLSNLSNNGNSLSGSFTATGNITAYSDQRLKENVKTIEGALDKVSRMRGVTYNYKSELNDGQLGTGVIAQEIQQVMPEVVEEGEYLSVAYGNIVGVLIEAVKELKAELDQCKCKKCECE